MPHNDNGYNLQQGLKLLQSPVCALYALQGIPDSNLNPAQRRKSLGGNVGSASAVLPAASTSTLHVYR